MGSTAQDMEIQHDFFRATVETVLFYRSNNRTKEMERKLMVFILDCWQTENEIINIKKNTNYSDERDKL